MKISSVEKKLIITVVADTDSLDDVTARQAVAIAADYLEEHGMDDDWTFYELVRRSYQMVEVYYVE